MWERKAVKRNARRALKKNYVGIVIACVLVSVIMGSFLNPIDAVNKAKDALLIEAEDSILFHGVLNEDTLADTAKHKSISNTEIVDETLSGAGIESDSAKRWTNGILSVFANNAEGAGSIFYGVLNSLNQFLFKDKIGSGIILASGVLIYLLIFIFFLNVIKVGFCRYILEARIYSDTKLKRLTFPWFIKRGWRIARTMLLEKIYLYLWSLTVVGGFIKSYSYRLVPMIIAENPDMSANEAITLSRRMMDGNKWRAFKLDLSFIGWGILNICTFYLLGIFFLTPYKKLAEAELYMAIRGEAKAKSLPNAEKLCDSLLDVPAQSGEYPFDKYIIKPVGNREWVQADYNRSYSISSLILIFFTFSFVGWLWEVSLHLFKDGVFVNRGVSYGPWLPIYGVGGVMVLVLLKRLRNKPVLTFFATMVLCGIVEYFTSWYLETTKGLKWWDYSGYFLNLNGRICLEGLLVFALGGCAAIYILAPLLDNLFNKIPKKQKIIICSVLTAVFLTDQVYSHFNPNTGKGITDYD